MSYIRGNNKFYLQVIDFIVNSDMPDLRAAEKNPYISSTSAGQGALTHKVIHRNCVELGDGDKVYLHRGQTGARGMLHYFYARV